MTERASSLRTRRSRSLLRPAFVAAILLVASLPPGIASAQAPELVAQKVLLDSLELKLPKDFVKMPPETMKKNYAADRMPNVVFMNPDGTVTVGITHTLTRMAPNQMATARTNAASQMKTAYPNAEVLRNEPNPIGNAGGYLLDLKINMGTPKAQRMMIVGTSLSGRLLNVVLTAPVKDEAKWAPTFDQIVDSIKIL
jgi:hypothetical protein